MDEKRRDQTMIDPDEGKANSTAKTTEGNPGGDPLGSAEEATAVSPLGRIGLRWVAVGIVALAVIAALFVPPISLLERLAIVGYETLSAQTASVSHPDGVMLRVDPESFSGRLRVRIESVPRLEFLEGSAGSDLKAAAQALPAHLEIKSPYYRIRTRNGASQPVSVNVALPDDAEPWETLDLYTWNGERWIWLGSDLHAEVAEREFVRAEVTELPESVVLVQAGAKEPTVSTYLDADDDLSQVREFDVVNPTGLLLGTMGGFAGDPESLVVPEDDPGRAVLPALRNWAPGGSVNAGLLADLLTDPAIQQIHIDNIVELCTERGFDGIEIDYRGVALEHRDAYASFIEALADALHEADLSLSVTIEQPVPVDGGWEAGGYDLAALGRAADAVKVPFPAAPESFAEDATAHRLLNWATAEVSRYKINMLVSSLSARAGDGEEAYEGISLEEALAPFGHIETLADLEDVEPETELTFKLGGSLLSATPQEEAGTHRIRYRADGGEAHTVWLGTPASLAHKLRWAERYHLGGVAVADALDPGNMDGVMEVIAGYGAEAQPPTDEPMEVAWAVRDSGRLIDEQTSPLTELSYRWSTPEEAGQFQVSASILGFDHGSLTVTVAEPEPIQEPSETITETETVTETEETDEEEGVCLNATFVADVTIPDNTQLDKEEPFDKTWRVRNSGTCAWPDDTVLSFVGGDQMGAPDSVEVGPADPGDEKEITVSMEAPAEDGKYTGKWQLKSGDDLFGGQFWVTIVAGEPQQAQPTPPPSAPPPSSGGGFELGGQTHTLAHPDEMHYAGMTWVKFQHKWSPGMRGTDVAGRIQQAHSNGFKVLLSIPGGAEYPSDIDYAGYVEFLREVAQQGPDAIEVWNEQNIDREWPAGQIDPAAYVQRILAPAYRAIKAVNPDIMVISGAPSPTGYFGGCSPAGCDDAPYVAGMLAAGAANYADCVGIHYNEGILPPSQTSGDPRGSSSHYTRYFWGMVNAYYEAFAGRRKLCFTELGYVSPEGYGTLPSNFAWAADTSVAEQAAWLAEAASLSASSGRVRLMIVYNVDFTLWSAHDPQAGYAIIRPDGSCPACDALHNVMGTR